METWIRTGIVLVATAIVGLFGHWQASYIESVRGALGPTILQSITPIASLVAVSVTVLFASVVGGCVGRISSSTTGMFILGFSLFAMALNMKGVQEFVMSEGNIHLLILESVLLGVIVLLGAFIVFALSGQLHSKEESSDEHLFIDIGKSCLISLSILPVIWFVANNPTKGQVIGASAVGGLLIGFLFRHFIYSMQPILLFALPIAVGGIGYFVGMTVGETNIMSFTQREMSTLLFPMPLEYAAGVIIGLSIGLGWTASQDQNSSSEVA